ncbi:MAG TPA: ABC transporter permease [Vicinamibacterales bacterium]|nr:ABC transporter permease [Vicinamibacterales bacterium]
MAAAISITVGIGVTANVLGFAVIRGALYKSLPYPDPDSLVQLSKTRPGVKPQPLSVDDLKTITDQAPAFRAIAACGFAYGTLRGSIDVRTGIVGLVTRDFFSVFEMPPVLGRVLVEGDFDPAARPVVISADVWSSLFGSAPDVLGQTLHVNREPWTVVGVMPKAFTPRCADERDIGAVWLPRQAQYASQQTLPTPGAAPVAVFARLAGTSSISDAQRQVSGLISSPKAAVRLGPRDDTEWSVGVGRPGESDIAGIRAGLMLLEGVALSLLLIASANLTNLLLSQASSRREEIALRFALGAGPSQIVGQLMTETTLVTTFGGVGGAVAAYWCTHFVARTATSLLPAGASVSVELPEFVAGATLGALLGAASGGIAAVLATRVLWPRANGGSGTGRASSLSAVRTALVAVEVAAATIVLVGAGLFIRSFVHVVAPAIGFAPQGLVVADVLAPPGLESRAAYEAFTNRFEKAVRLRFGQWPIAVANSMPSSAASTASWRLTSPNGVEDGRDYSSAIRAVSPDYFETLGVSIIRGSGFRPAGVDEDNQRLAVVSEAFVQQYGRGRDLLGFQIQYSTFPPFRVVGVARNTRSTMFSRESLDLVYVPLHESPTTRLSIAVRAPMAIVAGAVRDVARALDPDVVVVRVADLDSEMGRPTGTRYFYVAMMSLLGVLAIVLAFVGIFGVVSHATELRMREFAIRLALGEHPAQLARQVVHRGLRPVIAGLLVGMLIAWWLANALRANSSFMTQLYKVEPHDSWTLALVVVGLVGVAGAACLMPAIRALRIDPVSILKVN